MLQYRGFTQQDPATRAYSPGSALRSLAFTIVRESDVSELARSVLEQVNEAFDETVHLARLDGRLVHYLASVESSRAVRVVSRSGSSLPAHATSSGKSMLSQLSIDEFRRLYPEEELDAVTARTVTSRTQLESVLKTVRRKGYATSNEESEEGVESVAVCIPSQSGTLYSITTSVPTHRMSTDLRDQMARSLISAAGKLANAFLL
jgi:DNA-binding IclR family transcriptional regulator